MGEKEGGWKEGKDPGKVTEAVTIGKKEGGRKREGEGD